MTSIQGLVDELMRKSAEYYSAFGGEPYNAEDYRFFFEGFVGMPTESDFDDLVTRTSQGRAQLSYGSYGGDASDPVGGSVNVNNTLLDIDSVADELDEWRGQAASSFRDNVKTPFPGVVTNMFIAASVIHGAATAEQALWREANDNVEEILTNAINAVDSLDDCNPDEFVSLVKVIGAIGAVAVAGPGGAAIAIAAVSATGEVLDSGKEFGTGGGEPMVILGKTRTALQAVISDLDEGEAKVKAALQGVSSWMRDSESDYRLGGRPSLADGPGGLGGLK